MKHKTLSFVSSLVVLGSIMAACDKNPVSSIESKPDAIQNAVQDSVSQQARRTVAGVREGKLSNGETFQLQNETQKSAGAPVVKAGGQLAANEIQNMQKASSKSKENSIQGSPTAVIYDAWWTDNVDYDGDGYKSHGRLSWDPDVAGHGSLWVYEKIYWKREHETSWKLLTTTAPHLITGQATSDQRYIGINGGSHNKYDWLIFIYRHGYSHYDHFRDPYNDHHLNNYPMETSYEDVNLYEDCIPFNYEHAQVKYIHGSWKIVVGNMSLLDFGHRSDEAYKALKIIKYYRMNKQCFVGRPYPSMEYFLVDDEAPRGYMSGEDAVAFNPSTIQVRYINGSWKIVDGSHWILDFGSKQHEANKAYQIIKKYGFEYICFVGRPGASMTYFRKR